MLPGLAPVWGRTAATRAGFDLNIPTDPASRYTGGASAAAQLKYRAELPPLPFMSGVHRLISTGMRSSPIPLGTAPAEPLRRAAREKRPIRDLEVASSVCSRDRKLLNAAPTHQQFPGTHFRTVRRRTVAIQEFRSAEIPPEHQHCRAVSRTRSHSLIVTNIRLSVGSMALLHASRYSELGRSWPGRWRQLQRNLSACQRWHDPGSPCGRPRCRALVR